MPRRIIIRSSKHDVRLDFTLQQAFKVLLCDGIRVGAGSVNHHADGTINATVLLQDERDRPRALRVLRDAGISAKPAVEKDNLTSLSSAGVEQRTSDRSKPAPVYKK